MPFNIISNGFYLYSPYLWFISHRLLYLSISDTNIPNNGRSNNYEKIKEHKDKEHSNGTNSNYSFNLLIILKIKKIYHTI